MQSQAKKINTLYDIRTAIQKLKNSAAKPGADSTPSSIEHVDNFGVRKRIEFKIPEADSNYYNVLVDGFKTLKAKIELADKSVTDDGIRVINTDSPSWLNTMVANELGGIVSNLGVQWVIQEGTFIYYPLDDKLMRM